MFYFCSLISSINQLLFHLSNSSDSSLRSFFFSPYLLDTPNDTLHTRFSLPTQLYILGTLFDIFLSWLQSLHNFKFDRVWSTCSKPRSWVWTQRAELGKYSCCCILLQVTGVWLYVYLGVDVDMSACAYVYVGGCGVMLFVCVIPLTQSNEILTIHFWMLSTTYPLAIMSLRFKFLFSSVPMLTASVRMPASELLTIWGEGLSACIDVREQFSTAQCSTAQYSTVKDNTIQHYVVLCSVVSENAVALRVLQSKSDINFIANAYDLAQLIFITVLPKVLNAGWECLSVILFR